jgi:glutathione S-transferase
MITLYQFPPSFGLPNASPFCLKLETYLHMAELPFTVVGSNAMKNAPKGKMPYIEDQGQKIGDSNLVIQYLKDTYGDRLDDHLTPTEKAMSLAIGRMIDENLYWTIVHSRWMEPIAWEQVKREYFSEIPPVLRSIIPELLRKSVRKSLDGHGMGRHSNPEIYQIGCADIQALSDILGDKPFFMGDRPSSLDATAYGSLANILWLPIESPLQDKAKTLQNLAAFCNRMKERYYMDLVTTN